MVEEPDGVGEDDAIVGVIIEDRHRLVRIALLLNVTEADAMSGNTVKVRLTQIGKARPFSLCLPGQRRGRVQSREESAARQGD